MEKRKYIEPREAEEPSKRALARNKHSAALDLTARLPKRPSIAIFSPDGHVRTLADIETDVIILGISHYGGRLSEVSRSLGISRSTLYRKLRECGLSVLAQRLEVASHSARASMQSAVSVANGSARRAPDLDPHS